VERVGGARPAVAILGDRVAAVAIRDVRGQLGAPGLNGGGSACTSAHSINARSLSPAHPGPPWHGKGQGFESPKLHTKMPSQDILILKDA
jgi:hypothetical protein